VLAHHEDLGGARGQVAQAGFQGGEELLLLQRSFRLLPGIGRFLPVAALVEQRVELRLVAASLKVRGRAIAALAPDGVDDLVLEDAGEPGTQVGTPGKTGFGGECRQQGVLDRVLGGRGIAQLQRGVAQQVGAQAFDLGAEVGGGWQGGLKPGPGTPF